MFPLMEVDVDGVWRAQQKHAREATHCDCECVTMDMGMPSSRNTANTHLNEIRSEAAVGDRYGSTIKFKDAQVRTEKKGSQLLVRMNTNNPEVDAWFLEFFQQVKDEMVNWNLSIVSAVLVCQEIRQKGFTSAMLVFKEIRREGKTISEEGGGTGKKSAERRAIPEIRKCRDTQRVIM